MDVDHSFTYLAGVKYVQEYKKGSFSQKQTGK